MYSEFRAPPPSPVGSSRRASSVTKEDILTEFLEQSHHVTSLVLPPSRILDAVPTVDYSSLLLHQTTVARDALQSIGCFQLINHGVSPVLLKEALLASAGIFRLPTHRKKEMQRSTHWGFGFQDDDSNLPSQEFVWSDDYGFSLKLQHAGFPHFSEKMERLSSSIEEISTGIIQTLNKLDGNKSLVTQVNDSNSSSVCYIYNHPNNIAVEECISSFRYDVIRMMIRGSDFSHTLSLHVCEDECSEFHVYSKKGWVSFIPTPNALIVTVGDQMQAWTVGKYKHVIGRPIYTSEKRQKNSISMAFLCSPSTSTSKTFQHKLKEDENIITLQHQALFFVLFTFACQLVLFLYHLL